MSKRLIYAEDAIDALMEILDRPNHAEFLYTDEICKALEELPSAQPQLEECPIYGGMCGYPSNLCYECPRHEGAKEQPQWWTEGLQPFAQPQRMRGEWIEDGYNHYKAVCSECGEPCATYIMGKPRDKFCKWCGAEMRGDEE